MRRNTLSPVWHFCAVSHKRSGGGSVFTATALTACLSTLLMALLANYPFVLAPGMGLNAFFAYTVVEKMGFSWQMELAPKKASLRHKPTPSPNLKTVPLLHTSSKSIIPEYKTTQPNN